MKVMEIPQELSQELPQELLTGNNVIDEQHKEFFARLNMLYNDKDNFMSDKKEMLIYLAYAEIYTMEHFLYEEDLMEEKNYPEIENHRKAHRHLYKKVEDFRKSVEKTELTFEKICEFYDMFLYWLKSDIVSHDMKLAEFLNRNITKVIEK
jgi:hemerythrin